MPATSTKQRNLMGMVYAYKKGKLDIDELPDSLASKIEDIANGKKKKNSKGKTKGLTLKVAKEFAKTKHEDLPEYANESLLDECCMVVLTFDEHNAVDNFDFSKIGIDIDNVDFDEEDEIVEEPEEDLSGKKFDDNQENLIVQSESVKKFKDFI
jgi:hypothetical protein